MLLEHLAEAFPHHVQVHYGQYRREQLFEAARRSRACAYLADDDHGPLALQEILLAGCPTVGVRTGASFVRHGETGAVVDRLPPGASCLESDADAAALDAFIDVIEQAQTLVRGLVREVAAGQFDTTRIVENLLDSLSSISQPMDLKKRAYWMSDDLQSWTKGPSVKCKASIAAETLSNPFLYEGRWTVLYEQQHRIYRAVLQAPDLQEN